MSLDLFFIYSDETKENGSDHGKLYGIYTVYNPSFCVPIGVRDARKLLARTSRRFDAGQVDPEIARKVGESFALGICFGSTGKGRPDVNHRAV